MRSGGKVSQPTIVVTMERGRGANGGERRLCSKCAIDGWRPMHIDRAEKQSGDDCTDAVNVPS